MILFFGLIYPIDVLCDNLTYIYVLHYYLKKKEDKNLRFIIQSVKIHWSTALGPYIYIQTRKRSEYNSAVFFVSEDSPAIGGKWNIISDEKAPTYELSKIYSIATLGSVSPNLPSTLSINSFSVFRITSFVVLFHFKSIRIFGFPTN